MLSYVATVFLACTLSLTESHFQHNGTAVRSLAGEYLQELENFVGSERQSQEEAVMASMGSMYQGKLLHS